MKNEFVLACSKAVAHFTQNNSNNNKPKNNKLCDLILQKDFVQGISIIYNQFDLIELFDLTGFACRFKRYE